MAELSDLVRVRQDLVIEHDRQATEIADLAAEQKRMAALVEERQKRQAEVEHAMEEERQRVLALAHQADNLKDLIAKLEQGPEPAARRAGDCRPSCRRSKSLPTPVPDRRSPGPVPAGAGNRFRCGQRSTVVACKRC